MSVWVKKREERKRESNNIHTHLHTLTHSLRCSECGSNRIYKDDFRYTNEGQTQRYLCRECGYRFSEKSYKECQTNGNRQICALKVKNLASTAKTKIAGDLGKLPQDAKGLIAQFLAYLEKEGYSEETQYPNHLRRLAKRGANLRDPETVKAIIGKQKVKDGMKLQYVYAYAAFAKMLKIMWNPPKYKQEEIIPFIPDEAELDCLISACRSKRLAAYLQCLKETFGDPSEVL